MRNFLTTFFGVLFALLVFVGIRYLVRQEHQQQQENEHWSSEYEHLQSRENAARASLKTADACLSPLYDYESQLWPPVLEHHDKWTVAGLRAACGKPVRTAIYTDEKMNVGGLDYKDLNANLLHFEFGPSGVTVSYGDKKHVTNPDLIGSINSIPCLSAVK